jgi:PTH1 family peptidyl-tRNA hydrolase
MRSISGALDSDDFARVRIGIAPDRKLSDGAKYVLSQIKKSQVQVVDEALDNAADAVEVIITQGIQTAMNRYNRKVEPEAAE